MAKTGRNQPCPCGFRRKAKRCCGVASGPSPDQRATAWLRLQARQWSPLLAAATDVELEALSDELLALPARDLSLHLPLPRLVQPALEHLRRALAGGDRAAMVAALPAALELVDTPTLRARLASAVIALHDRDHRIDCELAACAILDLAGAGSSRLLSAALFHTLRVTAGVAPTPAGLLVASG